MSKDDDDEITVDFSKVKKFFTSMGKETEKEEKEEQKEDDDVAIDFSKVKGMFSGGKKGHKSKAKKAAEEESEDDSDVSIDWKKIGAFSKRHGAILLLLIPLFLAVFFRIQTAYLPATDDWAEQTVYNNLNNQIRAQVQAQYPNLPEANRERLVAEQFAGVLDENEDQLRQQIEATSQHFKSQLRDETGQTYLLAIDPFFWARHARNVANNGHPGDILVEGQSYDTHMQAPLGRVIPGDMMHAYLEGYLIKVMRMFNPDVPATTVAFYVPMFIAILAIIPAFFIAKRIGGPVGGLVAAVLLAVHGSFLTRTAAGFADTDAYNVVFPLFVSWLFLEAFETQNIKKRIGLATVAGFLLGMYSWAWLGWWYILLFLLFTSGVYLFYIVVRGIISSKGFKDVLADKSVRNTLILMAVFFLSSSIFVTLFMGFPTLKGSLYDSPMSFVRLKEVGLNVWPNVFTTVAEQNQSSLPAVIASMGGRILFFLAMLGVVLAFFKKDMHKRRDIKLALLLLIWIAATTFASVKGVRYTLLLVPAFSIAIGIFCGISYQWFGKWVSKELGIEKSIVGTLMILVFALLLWQPVVSGWNVAKSEIPSMNDAWYNALSKIRIESAPDAIINSWWDFGHWFKYIGDRGVTFDGTSQNTPQAHWIGKVLLTTDEKEAVGILRMLDCGATNAFDELDKFNNYPRDTIDQLYSIFKLDRSAAKQKLLSYGVSSAQAERVLEYSHCDPPENYFIASDDMIGKSGVWAHFGSWDFNRATMFNLVKKKNQAEGVSILMDQFGLDSEAAQGLYYEIRTNDGNSWIAPWPSYASGVIGCTRDGDTITCGNGLLIDASDPRNMDAYADSAGTIMHPRTFAFPTNDSMEIREYNDTILRANDGREMGVTLIASGGSNYAIIMSSPELAGSMFTRMFFMDGHGLEHFDSFTHERSFTGGDIYVYKVDWEGGDMNIMPSLKPKTEVAEGDTVTLAYIGALENGTVFDASQADWFASGVTNGTDLSTLTDDKLLSYTVGDGRILPGFEAAVLGMKPGEEKTFSIPPEQGYGIDPAAHPLGNKTLIFRVQVQRIE
ncbi:MAG: STT3 domain-containing protein [archaeon]